MNAAGHLLPKVVDLAEEVVRLCRTDRSAACRAAEEVVRLAESSGEPSLRAWAERAVGNVRHVEDRNPEAIQHYEKARQLFVQGGDKLEAARTFSNMVWPLALLGQYDRAMECVAAARALFEELGESSRLARLEINCGNLFYRQDRFSEALNHYTRALAGIDGSDDPEAYAVILSNQASTLVALNRFQEALRIYDRAREFCYQHGMSLLVARADYNIAQLHFLRGEYARAIELLNRARHSFQQTEESFHLGLTDLDEAEIWLELNQAAKARGLAQQAGTRFSKLDMDYEKAKSLVLEARAEHLLGHSDHALELFREAAVLFGREDNASWARIVNLYRALIHLQEGNSEEALGLAQEARAFFATQGVTTKEIFASLLTARCYYQSGGFRQAEQDISLALKQLRNVEAPWLSFHAHLLSGRIALVTGRAAKARLAYRTAIEHLDKMRGNIWFDEIKIGFIRDKLEVFETFVLLSLEAASNPETNGALGSESPDDLWAEAFHAMEQAKSRSLANLVSRASGPLPEPSGDPAARSASVQIQKLREELNGAYRRILRQEFDKASGQSGSAFALHAIGSREEELLDCLRRLPPEEHYNAGEKPAVSIRELQECLPEDTQVLEFFVAEQTVIAALIDRKSLRFFPGLALTSRLERQSRFLRFQLSKMMVGKILSPFEEDIQSATLVHLNELYRELILSLAPELTASQLVVIPHGLLHGLPFHALYDGEHFLGDRHRISYAPSATVLRDCYLRRPAWEERSLILATGDPDLPHVSQEVNALLRLLPQPEVFQGSREGTEALRGTGATARFLHVAGHGVFRTDQPLFSSIQVGEESLTLLDIYNLRLNCELVTLSGCATGRNAVLAGDELVGLTRGFLYAGAVSLVVSLWPVDDAITAEFMTTFYTALRYGESKTESLQTARDIIRARHPHPYYWAPFVLVGRP